MILVFLTFKFSFLIFLHLLQLCIFTAHYCRHAGIQCASIYFMFNRYFGLRRIGSSGGASWYFIGLGEKDQFGRKFLMFFWEKKLARAPLALIVLLDAPRAQMSFSGVPKNFSARGR
jgi:hypothetical protein